jgi:four helix bundle suffix protein
MVQAARSGKQNIAEGSVASGTSKKTELELVNVARASIEELKVDYQDYLRQHDLETWPKDHAKAAFIRKLAYRKDKSYATYRAYVEEKGDANAANTLLCLCNQATYLLDRLLKQLDSDFLAHGGFTEKLYRERKKARQI